MTQRIGSGWQTILTDLSLILFMLSTAAVSETSPEPPARVALTPTIGTPVALYRADPGAPPLRQWLKDQGLDDRLRLTIVAYYGADSQHRAIVGAEALAREAAAASIQARIIIEPRTARPIEASLAYDR